MAVSPQVPPTVRLVLVHGTRVSGVQWEVHRRWLSPTFDVATPDLPGHGTAAKVPFTMPRAVESVAAAVEAGPAGHPVVLVGHSWAAMSRWSMPPSTRPGSPVWCSSARPPCRPDRRCGIPAVGEGDDTRGTGPGGPDERPAADPAGAPRGLRRDRCGRLLVRRGVRRLGGGHGRWAPELLAEVRCPVLIVRGSTTSSGCTPPLRRRGARRPGADGSRCQPSAAADPPRADLRHHRDLRPEVTQPIEGSGALTG